MVICIKGVGWHLPDLPDSTETAGTDRSIPAMVLRAVQACLADAQVNMPDVDAVVTASVDLWDGKTASNIAITEVVGAVMKPETRIAGDGLLALIHAAMAILSGQYQRVLVTAHGKATEGDAEAISNWSFDPVYQQTLGLTDSHALGLQAQAFLKRAPGDIGSDSARSRIVSALSQENGELAGSEFLDSPVTFFPLHDSEIATQGDGACAVLLEQGGAGPRLEAFGYDLDPHYLGDRDLARCKTLQRAAQRGYTMATISDARKEIQRCYWSLRTAIQLPLWAEAAGVWSLHRGLDTLLQREVTTDGNAVHKTHWDGLPPFATGLQRLICATRDLRQQRAEGRVLVQGCHGPAGQTQVVCILSTER
ncbi:MAG: hypothetical protein ACE5IY_06405 [bacterium]